MATAYHSSEWLDEFSDAVSLYPVIAHPEYQHAFFTLDETRRYRFCELLSSGALPDEALSLTAGRREMASPVRYIHQDA